MVFCKITTTKSFYDKTNITRRAVYYDKTKENCISSTNDRLEKKHHPAAEDIQDALKDLLSGTIKDMMEAEMDNRLGYEKSEHSDNGNYQNSYKRKRISSRYGSPEIEVPQDRKSTVLQQIEDWQNRPSDEVSPILCIDAIHYSVQACNVCHSWH